MHISPPLRIGINYSGPSVCSGDCARNIRPKGGGGNNSPEKKGNDRREHRQSHSSVTTNPFALHLQRLPVSSAPPPIAPGKRRPFRSMVPGGSSPHRVSIFPEYFHNRPSPLGERASAAPARSCYFYTRRRKPPGHGGVLYFVLPRESASSVLVTRKTDELSPAFAKRLPQLFTGPSIIHRPPERLTTSPAELCPPWVSLEGVAVDLAIGPPARAGLAPWTRRSNDGHDSACSSDGGRTRRG